MAGRPIALLADVMGLGKTAQLIRAADLVGAERITVTCPGILCRNWAAEYAKFSATGLPVTRIRSSADTVDPGPGVLIIPDSLTVLRKRKKTDRPSADSVRLKKALLSRQADVLICDEAHRLKDPMAGRARYIMGRNGICHSHSQTWWSSGTPAPNHAGELYVFMCATGLYSGPYSAFLSEFCETADTIYGTKILGNKNVDRLKAMFRPHVLRRNFEDVGISLPRLEAPNTIYVDPDPVALAGVDAETLQTIERASLAGDWSLRDTPAMATARRIIGTAKAAAVAELALLDLDRTSEKLIIFGIHPGCLVPIAERLNAAGYATGLLIGDTSKSERERLELDFQNPHGATRVLCCNITVAAAGLNLTAASRVLMAEWAWTPSDNDQAIARAHRRGQTRPVRVSYISIAGSIDAQVTRTEGAKRERIRELY